MGRFSSRVRNWSAYGLAGGVVLVDSTSRILSMCADLVIVALLVAVLTVGRSPEARQ